MVDYAFGAVAMVFAGVFNGEGYGLAAYRLRPWLQVVGKQEDFRRSGISGDLPNRA
ncbi:MAG: hypothetical protein H0T50_05305, partial [Gemmatimonadales bacterium]|nr:hypothetical protein [Gemmatimonadales bacterium]